MWSGWEETKLLWEHMHVCVTAYLAKKKMGKVVGTHWKGNESEVGDGLTSNRRWEHRLRGKDKVQ